MKEIQLKIKFSLGLFIILITLVCGSCTGMSSKSNNGSSTITDPTKLEKKSPLEVSVMTYNVENMFDNIHDKDREDYVFLPLTEKSKPEVVAFCKTQNSYRRKECVELDWSDEVVKSKLTNVAGVIRSVDNGQGPDNLMLAEVENESILKRLVSEQLSDLGYQTIVLIEGPDLRGIDPAFISKFPLVGKPQLHLIPYVDSDPKQLKWAQRSRGILEVSVQFPNKKNVTFLIAHFPSQMNPTAWRAQAVKHAQQLMQDLTQQGHAVIFGGDLNITEEEDETEGFFKKQLSQVGLVSHLVGCKECLGSHNYKGEWSFLDVLVFSKNLKDSGLELIPESIQIVRTAQNMKRNGTPLAFKPEKKDRGVSDHFPLFSRLRLLK